MFLYIEVFGLVWVLWSVIVIGNYWSIVCNKLVIHRGTIGPEVNNQLTVVTEVEETNLLSLWLRRFISVVILQKNSILDVVLEQ